ncbi:carboxy terminal-processing peptidase [Robertkochia sediminum]|uniref:carboxy terminal-processing peptidase n=1 Tax=Robertkochia sediminum TaxID=2785326 RepID=UPI001932974F|nr:carboxy terminal-processing peptidase [Robertkochia sediminum]MBL7472988.1 carboxy terminal-processing peptidase [Robertkochia sediminum]
MKRKFVYFLAAMLISAASCSFTNKTFDNPDKDKLLVDLITYVLEKGHYNPEELDDDFSSRVYDRYIEALDPLKRFFLKEDIEEFEAYRNAIDDQLKTSDLSFFSLTYERLLKRMDEANVMYKKVLEEPFDFNKDEAIDVDYDKLDYVNTRDELWDRWKLQLKLSTLERLLPAKREKEEADEAYEIAELEETARENVEQTFSEFFDIYDDLQRKDWFGIYLNAVVEEFDPHTFYFAPEDKDRFDMSMSGKFEGIGARLEKRNDNIRVTEIISGGPAWRGEDLEVGDVITKVAQGNETPVSVVGMRLDDAVKLIKGPKGSEVKLTVRGVDGSIEVITITRDVVEIEETYAKSSVIERNGRSYGLINLPKFYIDFTDYEERNAATDVALEIERLKESGVEGLVLDLRNNGGGSLKTVVDIAGLFIKEGPVVQVRSTGRGKEVLADEDDRIQWDGPLVILVNELSASASEILAAAMQDYERAIVIGSSQTYGKGTVQNLIDLNQFLRGDNDFGDVGALKLTTQKFYRIDGGSTQLEGVKSDVVVPDKYAYSPIGERDQENPLPWDKIDPVPFEKWEPSVDLQAAVSRSKARIATNEQLKLIDENAKWIRDRREEKVIPLNLAAFEADVEKDEEDAKRFTKIGEYETGLKFQPLSYEIALMEQDSVLKKKRERWYKDLAGDVYMEEAINVLEDLRMSDIKQGKLAERSGMKN